MIPEYRLKRFTGMYNCYKTSQGCPVLKELAEALKSSYTELIEAKDKLSRRNMLARDLRAKIEKLKTEVLELHQANGRMGGFITSSEKNIVAYQNYSNKLNR
jgi:hypothetical protein